MTAPATPAKRERWSFWRIVLYPIYIVPLAVLGVIVWTLGNLFPPEDPPYDDGR